jgi:signal transduction histidine kinase
VPVPRPSRRSPRPPAHLITLVIAITAVPMATLLWLGWRFSQQDRVLEHQQIQQRVERGADLVVAALQRVIGASEQRMAGDSRQWPDGAVVVTFRDEAVEAFPRGHLAYLPVRAPLREAPATTFTAGENLEFRQRDPKAAVAVFHALAMSSGPATRAGALLGLGRNLHKLRRWDESLAAYGRLSEMEDVAVGGVPAALIGIYARCKLLNEQSRSEELRREAVALERDLRSGRWALTAPVYWLYAQSASAWSGSSLATPEQTEIFADAVGTLWDRWKMSHSRDRPSSGRESVDAHGQTVTVIWQESRGVFRALLAASAFLESEWLTAIAPAVKEQRIAVALRDAAGRGTFGAVGTSASHTATRSAADSGLPWNVVASSLDPPDEHREFSLRRRLLIAGLVMLVAMAMAASYLIVRAVSRELAVARLQSDFVAAVSHEFRTPLTSLRQFTDMLREQPTLDEGRRRVAYDAQSRATDRLTRLVETLLDFGRMQVGARRYVFEPVDCKELVGRVVDDFRGEARATGHDVDFRATGDACIDIDDEAMSRALRNLLDNAVKYSPEPSRVEVGLDHRNGEVLISVRDRGIGIPYHERGEIFAKFHRGEQARIRGIKGTGIGLAMVDEIVAAHHGRVDVDSEPGRGTTFTIALPVRGVAL